MRWTRFRIGSDEGPTQLVFHSGAPSAADVPLRISSFAGLVRAIRQGDEPLKRVVFIGRDLAIVGFGHALQVEYARTPEAKQDILWHAPGPREIFEQVWNECFPAARLERDLDGAIVLSPYTVFDTMKAWEFRNKWHELHADEPVAVRAARMYDALSLVTEAVSRLDAKLRREERHVDLQVYRHELRKIIEQGEFDGASGAYDFAQGELHSPSQMHMYRSGVGLMALPSLSELGTPRPIVP